MHCCRKLHCALLVNRPGRFGSNTPESCVMVAGIIHVPRVLCAVAITNKSRACFEACSHEHKRRQHRAATSPTQPRTRPNTVSISCAFLLVSGLALALAITLLQPGELVGSRILSGFEPEGRGVGAPQHKCRRDVQLPGRHQAVRPSGAAAGAGVAGRRDQSQEPPGPALRLQAAV